jgi:hypothetical protein
MDTTLWTLAQEKAALQLRCTVLIEQLTKVQRILLAEAKEIRESLNTIHELEIEVEKWNYELELEARQLKYHNGN